MRKICVFVGSRANWGRLKAVCQAITEHEQLELQLILGSSFYNADVPYKVDSRIQCLINSDDHEGMALTTGILLTKVCQELSRLKPDVVLVHGDRYEVLAVAQAAAYMNIPLAHTEGGEITGCIDDKVRNAITALADIHFPVTTLSSRRLINGHRNIYVVGSTALDGIKHIRNYNYPRDKVVVLYNPETSINESVVELIRALESIKHEENIVIVNPNVDAGSRRLLKLLHSTGFPLIKDLDNIEYAKLLMTAKVLVGNTSSGIKEGSFLGVPYVCIGNRQRNREHDSNVIFTDMCESGIYSGIRHMLIGETGKKCKPSNYFGDGTASIKISNILAEVEL